MIFVSHSHKDDDFVNYLFIRLDREGHQTWVDHRNAEPGADWPKAVQNALEVSDTMIVVLSPDSISSSEVEIEWSYFKDHGKKIIPLVVKPCEEIPLRLRLLHRIDFTNSALREESVEKLINALPKAQKITYRTAEMPEELFEFAKTKEELTRLKSQLSLLYGKNQILFAFPHLHRSNVFNLDKEKIFVGWFDRMSRITKPEIDLTQFGARDHGLSRQHALLSKTSKGLILTDLDSTNGTFVGERRLAFMESVPLRNEEILRFGTLIVQIFFNEFDY